MQDAAVFWDKVSAKYAKSPISDEAAYQLTLDKTRGYLTKSDRVLEVGCGTGSTAILLAPGVAHITASDVSGKMIEIGKGRALAENVTNISFEQADVLDAAFEAEPYDAVLAHNLLHLLENLPGALKMIHRRLKPGGMFISKTVTAFGENTPLKWKLLKVMLPVMQFLGKAPYVNFMQAAQLEAVITAAGFDLVESGNYPTGHLCRYIVARKR